MHITRSCTLRVSEQTTQHTLAGAQESHPSGKMVGCSAVMTAMMSSAMVDSDKLAISDSDGSREEVL